jgi:type II secretory pathway pseudopilin PulG
MFAHTHRTHAARLAARRAHGAGAARTHRVHGARRARGALLLGLLIALAITGLGLLVALDVWAVTRQRQQEEELLFVGEQYRAAIQRYYFAAPKGMPRTLPASLKDLLQDERYSIPVRHLRRTYADPLTGEPRWGAVMQANRIAGVYSLAKGTPLKQGGFARQAENFTGRSSYREWAFVFVPPNQIPGRGSVRPPPGDGNAPAPTLSP